MKDFKIEYKIGKGDKVREVKVQAESIKEASINFLSEATENTYVVQVVEIKTAPKARGKKMSINNKFDEFLAERLETMKLDNDQLYPKLKMSKSKWIRMRNNPENFTIQEVIMLSEALNTDLQEIVAIVEPIAKLNLS